MNAVRTIATIGIGALTVGGATLAARSLFDDDTDEIGAPPADIEAAKGKTLTSLGMIAGGTYTTMGDLVGSGVKSPGYGSFDDALEAARSIAPGKEAITILQAKDGTHWLATTDFKGGERSEGVPAAGSTDRTGAAGAVQKREMPSVQYVVTDGGPEYDFRPGDYSAVPSNLEEAASVEPVETPAAALDDAPADIDAAMGKSLFSLGEVSGGNYSSLGDLVATGTKSPGYASFDDALAAARQIAPHNEALTILQAQDGTYWLATSDAVELKRTEPLASGHANVTDGNKVRRENPAVQYVVTDGGKERDFRSGDYLD